MEKPVSPSTEHPTISAEAGPASIALDVKPQAKSLRGLSPAFKSIEDQMQQTFPEALAKLRDPELDFTRALVSVRARGGKQTPALMLADFVILDFARACAEEIGQGGPLSVVIDPNDGKGARFAFGFVAPQVEVAPEAEARGLRSEIEKLRDEVRRSQQLAMLGGGGVSTDEQEERFLRKMQLYKSIFEKPASNEPPRNVVAEFQQMSQAAGQMFNTALGVVKDVGQAAQAVNPAAAAAAEAKAYVEVAKEALPLAIDTIKTVKGLQAMKPAGLTDRAKAAAMGAA